MNIDNWPLDKIMRLPDWCFGRRWWVGTYCGSATGTAFYGMSQETLPDKIVVWGVLITNRSPVCLQAMRLTIRLGYRVPANVAEATALERLFKNISEPNILYEFYPQQNASIWINAERLLLETKGRHLCFVANGDQAIAYEMTAGVLISAMPQEVPDWLILGREENP